MTANKFDETAVLCTMERTGASCPSSIMAGSSLDKARVYGAIARLIKAGKLKYNLVATETEDDN